MMLIPRRNYGLNLFDEFFNDPFFTGTSEKSEDSRKLPVMRTDITERDGNYLLEIELPGFKKEDINLELNNGYLTVSAHKDEGSGDKDESGKWLRRERYVGTCSRSFYVGDQVKENDIHANYQNGTLRIQVPKIEAQPQVESKHQIAIEG